MSEQTFKKGDAVPHWVLNVTPKERVRSVTFGADVNVTTGESGVTVRPAAPLAEGECLVYIDGNGKLNVQGAPTTCVS